MKKTIILFFFICNKLVSQDTANIGTFRNDSLFFKNERSALIFMRENLKGFGKEYNLGLTGTIGGGAVAIIGILTKKSEITIGGGIVSGIGSLIMILSHRHIRNASRWHFEPNGVSVNF